MKRVLICVLACILSAGPVFAEQRIIVRALGGLPVLNTVCLLLGCQVDGGLEDPLGQVFLLRIADSLNLGTFLARLSGIVGIVNVEPDSLGTVLESRPPIPSHLYDSQLVPYFGVNVRRGYILQPAAQIVRLADAQSTYEVSGDTIVAVIDTGVDPDHPVLRNILLRGYDYTRKREGTASEMGDVNQSTAAVVDGVPPTYVGGSAAAVVDQSTAAVVDDPDHAAFGHGTMVAGIIHLVAPRAKILPLKAFGANGSGYTSDILRAIYRATREGARVINMSFSMPGPSKELKRAIDHASNAGAICVASTGNQGQAVQAYPASWSNVIGVASTNNADVRSTFSNYGQDRDSLVAAPGEGIVTTYPFGTWAAAWGTSFSTPFVSGTVALIVNVRANLSASQVNTAIGKAQPLGPELGRGRLDTFRALDAVRTMP
jgi:subtilisin family serine protease